MKLSEALAERKEFNQRIKRLTERLLANLTISEGEKPQEDPADLRRKLTEALEALRILTLRINFTNVSKQIDGTGETITEAIARKDMLQTELGILRQVAQAIRQGSGRFLRGEVKQVVLIRAGDLEDEIDEKARELRELDGLLQAANFQVELVELEPA